MAAGIESRQLVKQTVPYSYDPTAAVPGGYKVGLMRMIAHYREGWLKYRNYNALQKANVLMTTGWYRNGISLSVNWHDPDIVHIHWPGLNFVPIPSLRYFGRPIVWTFQDMWAFTGGCHYSSACTRYEDSCGCCPELGSDNENDLTHQIWKRKQRQWKDIPITVVAPSNWMKDCARSSSLFKDHPIEVIPNSVDVQIYYPAERDAARKALGLPRHKMLVLFGAMVVNNPRKGSDHLISALKQLTADGKDVELITFGQSHVNLDVPVKVHEFGQLNDDVSLRLVYSAADVYVSPALQEALGNTIIESMACGVPVVAFRTGGINDIIDHQQNGYLATYRDTNDLTIGIRWILEDSIRYQNLAQKAHEKILNKFAVNVVAQQHISLYEGLLQP